MENQKILGIVGGVGPEASNKFCEFLVRHKKAKNDQDHLQFINFCNPKIPDRTEFITGLGKDPTEEIIKTCETLKNAGANFLVIPCNTAHYFLPEIQERIDLPVVDMTKVLVKEILKEIPPIKKVGILATTGSIIAGIYQNYFKSVDVEPIVPDLGDQENLVMRAIYGSSGIKAGKKTLPKKLLLKAAKKLIDQGAEAIVLGCTEIPLVLKQKDLPIKTFDPMELTAKEIIRYIETEEEKMVTIKYSLSRPRIEGALIE